MSLPEFNASGDLPRGVHPATLGEVLLRFAESSPQRRNVGARLKRVYDLVVSTGAVGRFIVFGSFVSDKPNPNDVDIFLVMGNEFDLESIAGEARLVFDHGIAQAHFGASIFWLREVAALPNVEASIAGWEIKRDGSARGLIEVSGA